MSLSPGCIPRLIPYSSQSLSASFGLRFRHQYHNNSGTVQQYGNAPHIPESCCIFIPKLLHWSIKLTSRPTPKLKSSPLYDHVHGPNPDADVSVIITPKLLTFDVKCIRTLREEYPEYAVLKKNVRNVEHSGSTSPDCPK
jgi:hypothetical protein